VIKIPKPYPNPSINQSSDLITHANDLTEGWAGTGMIVTIFVVVFLLMKGRFYKTSDSMAVASTLTLILGSMIWAMGELQGNVLMIFLAATIASVLWSIFDTQQ